MRRGIGGDQKQCFEEKQRPARADQVTHMYMLVIKPDGTFEVTGRRRGRGAFRGQAVEPGNSGKL